MYYPTPGHDPWLQTFYDEWMRAQAWGSWDGYGGCGHGGYGGYGPYGGYLGAPLPDVQNAQISGFLSQLYLVSAEAAQPVPGAQAFVAGPLADCQAAGGGGRCAKNALDTLRDTIAQNPQAKVYANPQTATPTHVDLVVALDAASQAVLSSPQSAFGEVTIAPAAKAAPMLAARPAGTTGGLLIGAVVGGALGAAVAGGVGGVVGALAGGLVGNQVTKA